MTEANLENAEKTRTLDQAVTYCTNQNASTDSENQCFSSENIIRSNPSEFFSFLLSKAPKIEGHTNGLCPLQDIEWKNESLIQDGINFHQKYNSLIYTMSSLTILLSMAVKPFATVVYRMGKKFKSEEKIFKRAVADLNGVPKFYEVFNLPPHEVSQWFQRIVRLHVISSKRCLKAENFTEFLPDPTQEENDIARAINMDLQFLENPEVDTILDGILTWNPKVPVSQLDMTIVQLINFYGLWSNPKKYGLEGREQLKGFMHCWAIFGRLLGIKDEFNICLNKDPEVFHELFRNVSLGSIRRIDSYGVHLHMATVRGIQRIMPFFTYKGFLYGVIKYFYEVEGYTGENLQKLMDWKDKLFVNLLKVYLRLWKNIPGFRVAANAIFHTLMKIMVRKYL